VGRAELLRQAVQVGVTPASVGVFLVGARWVLHQTPPAQARG
jgi:hypothetical protein